MSEFEEWWRRTRRFFEEIDRMIDEMMREAFRVPEERGRRKVYGPYFYGFSVTIGPDGIPRIREWGNIRPGPVRPMISETVEPFTDIIEEEDVIKVIIDMPGVEKEDIKVEATERTITVSAERGERKYYKKVSLPKAVVPETARAQYKNGVLTITVKKAEAERKKGFTIKVE